MRCCRAAGDGPAAAWRFTSAELLASTVALSDTVFALRALCLQSGLGGGLCSRFFEEVATHKGNVDLPPEALPINCLDIKVKRGSVLGLQRRDERLRLSRVKDPLIKGIRAIQGGEPKALGDGVGQLVECAPRAS